MSLGNEGTGDYAHGGCVVRMCVKKRGELEHEAVLRCCSGELVNLKVPLEVTPRKNGLSVD